ncbi:MAG: TonB-dependent receptor [Parafilimonas terrae]|nr:TonB-dependent receptor [Parafilimonas terrae]
MTRLLCRAPRRACASALLGLLLSLNGPSRPHAEDAPTTEVRLDGLTVETTASPRGVVPAYAGGQVAAGGRVGLLGNVEAAKSPFNVASYTDTFIRDRQAATVSEALALDPSVRATQTTGAPFDSLYIRGFPSNEGISGETAFDGLYGIAPNFRVFADYAERIEVLKGPSAALSGIAPAGGVGGTVNIVPKRAGEDLTRFTLDYGSRVRGGGQIDLARRGGENREWGLRFIGSLHGGDTPFDHQSERAEVGALALDYQGERFRAWLYLITQSDRFDAPLRPFLLKAGLPVPKVPDGRRNLTQPWETYAGDDQGGLLRLEYDLAPALTLFGDVGGSRAELSRIFASAPTITNLRGDTLTAPQFYGYDSDRLTADGGLRAGFDTGFVHHALTVQASYYQEAIGRWLSPAGRSYRSNIYVPALVPPLPVPVSLARPRFYDSTLTGLSVADTLSVLDEHLLLTLGVRRQTVEARNYAVNVPTLTTRYDRSAVSPLVGVVLRATDTLSVYGNYIEGLRRGEVAPAVAVNVGTALAPYVARQVEVGVKADWGAFSTTLAAFRITKPSGELGPGRNFAQTGETQVEGLELGTYGEVTPGLRALGGVTLLEGTLTRTAVAANVGHTPIGVPRVQLNLGAEWDVPGAPGLTLDGSVVHTGRQFLDAANLQAVPAWTRLDLGARYATLVGGRRTVFRAGLQNVTGTRYWTGVASYGTFFQGAPRTYLLSMSVDL